MKNFAAKKEKYFSDFADLMTATFLKMKYGIASCNIKKDADLITMRYELAYWQSSDDFSSLSEIKHKSINWLPIDLECDDICNITIINNNNNVGEGKTFRITPARSVWSLVHDLTFTPNVTTTDDDGQEIIGTVTYVNDTLITVMFSQPVSGMAYLS
jgi:hypothetical protein